MRAARVFSLAAGLASVLGAGAGCTCFDPHARARDGGGAASDSGGDDAGDGAGTDAASDAGPPPPPPYDNAAHDLNGDGYADLVVGARGDDTAGPDFGAVLIWFGGPGPLAPAADLVLTGDLTDSEFGDAIAFAGDLNGDGFADLLVGAPSVNESTDPGRCFVFFGGAALDGVPDGILAAASGASSFGMPVSSAGDVNGDGYADVIVGFIEQGSLQPGAAYVYLGGPGAAFETTADALLTGATAGDYFGHSLSAGDVNSDGFSDLIVGAPGEGPVPGAAYVFQGGPGDFDPVADVVLSAPAGVTSFGIGVASLGDVNGDAEDDFVVTGNAGASWTGVVTLYLGGAAFDSVPDATVMSSGMGSGLPAPNGDAFGARLAAAGDLDRDGHADLLVGAYFDNTLAWDAGRAYVFYGAPGGFAATPLILAAPFQYDYFGYAVGGAGDVHGDGYPDALVGGFGYSETVMDGGRADLFPGGPDGLGTLTEFTALGTTANMLVGIGVGTAIQ